MLLALEFAKSGAGRIRKKGPISEGCVCKQSWTMVAENAFNSEKSVK